MRASKRILPVTLWFLMTVGCLFLYGLLFLYEQKHLFLPLISCQFTVIVCLFIVRGKNNTQGKLLVRLVKPVVMGVASVIFSVLLCMSVNNLSLKQTDEYDAIVTRTYRNSVYFEDPDGVEQQAAVLDLRIIIVDEGSQIQPQQYVRVREYVGLFGLDHYKIVKDSDES